MFYVGIDDTDVIGSPGTNKLARSLIGSVSEQFSTILAVRHQLLFDPRVPYTSKNSAASIVFEPREGNSLQDLAALLCRAMMEWFVEGSDPGLCITENVPPEVIRFGRRCQCEVVSQAEARELATAHGIYLEGLGGTNDGMIGALAAVGLFAGGNDGRVVAIDNHPDDLEGQQAASFLHSRGVAEIRVVDSDEILRAGKVDVGKHLRPNYRDGKVVLYVESTRNGWQAVRRQ